MVDEAFDKFNQTIEVTPEYAGAYSNLAYIYGMRGNYELMEENAKKALRYDPFESPARFNLAQLYLNTGRERKSIEQFEKIAKISPDDAGSAYNQLGVIYARKNDLGKAIQYWGKALEADPDNQNAKANYQRAKSLVGK